MRNLVREELMARKEKICELFCHFFPHNGVNTFHRWKPLEPGYGRIVRDAKGRVNRIVEHKDVTADLRKLAEINCGIYCADALVLMPLLKKPAAPTRQ